MKRLTPHQREVYDRIVALEARGVAATPTRVRCPGACAHLAEKGWVTREVHEVGPRGGITYRYRPTQPSGESSTQ